MTIFDILFFDIKNNVHNVIFILSFSYGVRNKTKSLTLSMYLELDLFVYQMCCIIVVDVISSVHLLFW